MLLTIGPRWCPWTDRLRREIYTDASVAAVVDDRFVPVWVDADQRPDISTRYSLGGWPTTAFLTPDGQLLGGETCATAERLLELLPRVADAFARRRDSLEAAVDGAAGGSPADRGPDRALGDWVSAHLLDQFDPEYGGFGRGVKRIHGEALELARLHTRAGDTDFEPVVERTRDAIAGGGLYDRRDGGVFRFCGRRDWSEPGTEKLVSGNAAALRVLLESTAEDTAPDPVCRDRAVDLVHFVRRTFVRTDPAGFATSRRADAAYYAAGPDAAGISPPPVDTTVYADGTARMARAYAVAARRLDDESLLAFAADAVEQVVAGTYTRGGGIGHQAAADGPRGLLTDQVRVSAALLDLYLATERDVYLDMAQELMHFAGRALWDEPAGGFRDRVHHDDDIGLLREPVVPFGLNCEAARVLARLAVLAEAPAFHDRALRTLGSQNASVRAHGVEAAPYALALHDLDAGARAPVLHFRGRR